MEEEKEQRWKRKAEIKEVKGDRKKGREGTVRREKVGMIEKREGNVTVETTREEGNGIKDY